MQLYGFGNSRSFRVIWMFKELGIDFDYIQLNPFKGDLEEESFLSLNPSGKVPVLVDENLVLTESAAIITYLGDKYPNSGLVPNCGTASSDIHARARYNQWCYFAMTELEQPLWTIAKHQFSLPKKYRIPKVYKTAIYEFRNVLGILEKGLGHSDWILGEQFTAVDILIGHSLHWAQSNKIKLKNVTLEQYYIRLSEREAFKQAVALS